MRKKTNNKKVIQALTIGITAMMAITSVPMEAMAADIQPTGDDDKNKITTPDEQSHVCDVAQEKAEEASAALQDNDSVKGIESAIAGAVQAEKAADEAEDIKTGIKLEENTATDDAKAVVADVVDAKNDVSGIEANLIAAEAADNKAELSMDTANTAATGAESAVSEMEAINKQVASDVDTELSDMRGATDVTTANNAYDELQATFTQAEANFTTQIQVYNDNKKALEDAIKAKEEAEATYKNNIASASTAASDAFDKLKEAEDKVNALQKAVTDAEKGIKTKYQAALAIADKENLTKNDGQNGKDNLVWGNEDKLFTAIMANYYIPKLDDFASDATVELNKDNSLGKDGEYNYFKVTYKNKKGNLVTKYYDYKMDGKSTDSIIIYEEREVAVQYGKDLKKGNIAATTENAANYDSYTVTDASGKTVSLDKNAFQAALDANEIVAVEGKYFYLDAGTPVDIFTDGTTEDGLKETIVSDKNEASYKIDNDGNVVKEVKAEVTTITYSNAFTSQDGFAGRQEAEDAATQEINDLKEVGNQVTADYTIKDYEVEKEIPVFQTTGYYIPTFTQTVDITHEEDYSVWSELGLDGYTENQVEGANEAKADAQKALMDKQDIKDGGLYMIPDSVIYNSVETKVTDENIGYFNDYPDSYEVKVNATATYARVTKTTVSLDAFKAFLGDIGLSDDKEKQEAAAREWVESQHGIFVGFQSFNWDWNTADVFYLAAKTVTSEANCTSKEDAQAGALTAAEKANGIAVYNYVEGETKESTNTEKEVKYKYEIEYLAKAVSGPKEEIVQTTTYSNANVINGVVEQDMNYKSGKYAFVQSSDKDYRQFVDTAVDAANKYAALKKTVADAQAEVSNAKTKVNALQSELITLQNRDTKADQAIIKTLTEQLALAEAKKVAAQNEFNTLKAQLNSAQQELTTIVDSLTATQNRNDIIANVGGAGNISAGAVNYSNANAGIEVATNTDVVTPLIETTVNNTVANAGQVQGQQRTGNRRNTTSSTTINDSLVATTSKASNTLSENSDESLVNIDDQNTALAGSMQQGSLSRKEVGTWWWLAIAVFGAAGVEAFRRYQLKKKNEEH